MNVLRVSLRDDEHKALRELAQRERRDLRAQAALLIRNGLEQARLLPTDTSTPVTSAQVSVVSHGG